MEIKALLRVTKRVMGEKKKKVYRRWGEYVKTEYFKQKNNKK